MIIKKIFNNNVILSENAENKEVVVMGRGLAFQKRVGDIIDQKQIEKVFTSVNNMFSEHFSQLMTEIQPEYLELVTEIVEVAREDIEGTLNDNIYITLVDHLSFAVSRHQMGYEIKNALLWDTKKFYPKEFQAGLKAIDLIEKHFSISLGEDEAGFVALHFVNAQQDVGMLDITNKVTDILQTVIGIVQLHYGVVLDETSLNYARFITHLQFFVRRVLQNEAPTEGDEFLYKELKYKYPNTYECIIKIRDCLRAVYNIEMTKSEQVYLMLHIYRVAEKKT